MSLNDFLASLDTLAGQAAAAFDAAESDDLLEEARVEFLGAKSGQLKAVQKQMGKVEKADKPVAGKKLNEVKNQIQAAFDAAKSRLEDRQKSQTSSVLFDTSLPGKRSHRGRLHPLTQTIEEAERHHGAAWLYRRRWPGD